MEPIVWIVGLIACFILGIAILAAGRGSRTSSGRGDGGGTDFGAYGGEGSDSGSDGGGGCD